MDLGKCNGCGISVQVCPYPLFAQDDKGTMLRPTDEELCILCGHCVAVCPQKAIVHSNMEMSGFVVESNRR